MGIWNTCCEMLEQALHLWRLSGGCAALMHCTNKLKNNKEYLESPKDQSQMLLSRRNQLLLQFSSGMSYSPEQAPTPMN